MSLEHISFIISGYQRRYIICWELNKIISCYNFVIKNVTLEVHGLAVLIDLNPRPTGSHLFAARNVHRFRMGRLGFSPQ